MTFKMQRLPRAPHPRAAIGAVAASAPDPRLGSQSPHSPWSVSPLANPRPAAGEGAQMSGVIAEMGGSFCPREGTDIRGICPGLMSYLRVNSHPALTPNPITPKSC